MTHITSAAVVCMACRSVGMLHCSDPMNCGNMKTQADSWKSWLDDLPVPAEFDEGVGCLQEYITAMDCALALLSDPVAVHANMLRGTIAKPTWAQINHLYPSECAAAHRAGYEAARADAAKAGWHLLDYEVFMRGRG